MAPSDPSPDPEVAERDRHRYDLFTPLSVVTASAELLKRRILRADGLANVERDLMLGTLATLRMQAELLQTHLETLIGQEGAQPDPPASSAPTQPPQEPA